MKTPVVRAARSLFAGWVLLALVFGLSLCNFRYGNRNAED